MKPYYPKAYNTDPQKARKAVTAAALYWSGIATGILVSMMAGAI